MSSVPPVREKASRGRPAPERLAWWLERLRVFPAELKLLYWRAPASREVREGGDVRIEFLNAYRILVAIARAARDRRDIGDKSPIIWTGSLSLRCVDEGN